MTAADPTELATVEQERSRALLGWYEQNRRELPWRETRDPYPILVSEVMLQQTQVQRVVPFFEAFLRRFPTVDDLAGAPLRDVLEVWSGLGYNSRARRLHLAAIAIATDGWPDTLTGLNGLPGVGPYMANAIACFAWGADAVPIDTNVRRVLSRWHGEPLEPRHLQTIANADAAGVSSSTFAQAVMDLGSSLCLPRNARCHECPAMQWCTGPDVYVAPRPQPRFEGSARQIRGAVVRALVVGTATAADLTRTTGFPNDRIIGALEVLREEGMVVDIDGQFSLPE